MDAAAVETKVGIVMNHRIFVCENSIEGILTGVYEAWTAAKEIGHSHCKLETKMPRYALGGTEQKNAMENTSQESTCRNFELFSEYYEVEPDAEKSRKVTRTVCDRLGMYTYQEICKAIAAEAPDLLYGGNKSEKIDKGDAVYKTIVTGFSMDCGEEVMTNLVNPYVSRTFELARRVNREIEHLLGFLRFKELRSGVLFSRIGPENSILPMLAPHFSDRLPLENFMIYDEKRGMFVVHRANDPKHPVSVDQSWALIHGESPDEVAITDYSDQEEYYQELFKAFCHSITIEARVNPKLQQQMLPLRHRAYMVEFEQRKG